MSKNYSSKSNNDDLTSKNYSSKSNKGDLTSKNYSLSKKKDNNQYSCPACGKTYSRPSGVSNHKQRCKVILGQVTIQKDELDQMLEQIKRLTSNTNNLEKENKRLQKQTNNSSDSVLKAENQLLREQINDLHKDKNRLMEKLFERSDRSDQYADRFADMADTNADLAKTTVDLASKTADIAQTSNSIASSSMSTLSYLTKFIKNAPPLKPIANIPAMIDDFESEYHFALELISFYINGTLVDNIVQYIIGKYKKKDINEQSLWNSDANRINYAISRKKRGNDTTWERDVQGVTVRDTVIRPVLTYIKELLQLFVQDKLDTTVNPSTGKQKQLAVHIICLIDDHKLEVEILKNIAPHLRLTNQPMLENKEQPSEKAKPNKTKKGQRSSKPPKKDILIKQPKKHRTFRPKGTIKVAESEDEELLSDKSEIMKSKKATKPTPKHKVKVEVVESENESLGSELDTDSDN